MDDILEFFLSLKKHPSIFPILQWIESCNANRWVGTGNWVPTEEKEGFGKAELGG